MKIDLILTKLAVKVDILRRIKLGMPMKHGIRWDYWI